MARTIPEIKKVMTDEWISNPEIIAKYNLDVTKTFEQQFAKVSLESIRFFVFAFGHWLIEKMFDTHLQNVDKKIRNQRPHTFGWYRTTALNFQFGGVFKEDITEYDNSNLSDEEIEKQKIITKCSIAKADTDKPTLIYKVAKDSGKLNEVEKIAFNAYMAAKTDAGINFITITENPDRLVLFLTVRYDAMVMDANGVRLLDGLKPVEEGIKKHLNNLIFNGTFYPSLLEQDIMKETGIKIVTTRLAQVSVLGQSLIEVGDKYEPYSGALKIDIETDLHVTYERF